MTDATDADGAVPAVDPITDLAVRTVYGEAADQPPEGQQAVISTAINRSKQNGTGIAAELTAPNQYQAWKDPELRAKMQALSPGDPEYQAILKTIAPVLSGDVKTPYTQYLNRSSTPAGSSALTTWAAKPGDKIGDHEFYPNAPPQGASDEDMEALARGQAPTAQTASDAELEALARGNAPKPSGVKYSNDEDVPEGPQAQAWKRMNAAAQIDPDAPNGSIKNPFGEHAGSVPPPGAWVLGLDGNLRQMPGGEAPPSSMIGQAGAGFNQGLRDVGGSIAQGIQAVDHAVPVLNGLDTHVFGQPIDKTVADNTRARNVYNQEFSNNQLIAPLARFAGQTAVTAPVMAGAGAGVNMLARGAMAAAPEAAPVVNFLTGHGGGNALMSGGSKAVSGAVQGATGAALTSSSSDAPLAEQMKAGALVGGALAPAIGGTQNALARPTVAPEVQSLAQKAVEKYGIPLRASQILGTADRNAAIRDSELISAPGSGYAANNAQQARAFTRAAARTIGVDSPVLTPEVMDEARKNIGSVFDKAAASTGAAADDQLVTDLAKVGSQARELGLDQSQINALDLQIKKITDLVRSHSVAHGGTGVIPGDVYQTLTENGSSLSKIMKNDHSSFADLASDIRGALDDSVARAASPEEVAALQKARFQWKNLKTLQPLAAKSTDGTISPAALRGRVMAQFPNFAFGDGGDLGDLARIGQTFMKEPPNSGTAPRLLNALKVGAGGGAVADMGLAVHDPVLAAKLAATGAAAVGSRYAVNALRGAANNNSAARNALIYGAKPSLVRQAVTGALNNSSGAVGVAGRNYLLPNPAPAPQTTP